MRNQIVKRIAAVLLAGVMIVSLAACGGNKKTEEKAADDSKKETEIQVFIAASLNTVMTELAKEYNEARSRRTGSRRNKSKRPEQPGSSCIFKGQRNKGDRS